MSHSVHLSPTIGIKTATHITAVDGSSHRLSSYSASHYLFLFLSPSSSFVLYKYIAIKKKYIYVHICTIYMYICIYYGARAVILPTRLFRQLTVLSVSRPLKKTPGLSRANDASRRKKRKKQKQRRLFPTYESTQVPSDMLWPREKQGETQPRAK